MPELPHFGPGRRDSTQAVRGSRDRTHAVRVGRVATRQGGVIGIAQLRALAVSSSTVSRWRASGHLHWIYPGVFAVGHRAIGLFGRLNAALLYCGGDAALSHQTAGYRWKFLDAEPTTIHVSRPGRRLDRPGLRVHHPRLVRVVILERLPVTTPARTLRDLAWVLPYPQARRALAEADHEDRLDPVAVYAELGRGRRGSTALRKAMAEHLPELASTFSVLEERFLAMVDDAAIPLPEVNVTVEGLVVDCVWRHERLIVELDGHETHDRTAAIENDRHREMRLRRAGYRVLRYTWHQVVREGDLVIAELRDELRLP